ncbi:MAG TPA: PTS glucose/sucrose transporter subunit IIB, partial [Atopostipes sp.]|nr:PTS glucose/sucrose transporter subunit IIB [Atopostipes sp.]
IERFDLKTLGRGEMEEEQEYSEVELEPPLEGTASPTSASVQYIIDGLGGISNIDEINNCYTRLRIDVKDPSLVDEATLKKGENSGIITRDNHIQIVIGRDVDDVREQLDQAVYGISTT